MGSGHPTDLGTLGGEESQAYAINDAGEVVGASQDEDGHWRAFHWRAGRMTDLGTLGGADSSAFDINDAGEIVGIARDGEGALDAVYWGGDHEIVELGERVVHEFAGPGTFGTRASALNASRQIVGYYHSSALSATLAYRLDGLDATESVPLRPTGFWPYANAVNSAGVTVCCGADEANACHATAWGLDGQLLQLPEEPSSPFAGSAAMDINSSGKVVGWGRLEWWEGQDYHEEIRAVIWHLPGTPQPDPDRPPPGPEPPPADPGAPPPDQPAPDPVPPTPAPAMASPTDRVPSAGFTDTAGNAHRVNINCAVWYGLAHGLTATTYLPAEGVRRDQMASFVARLIDEAGADLPAPRHQGFDDTAGNVHADRIDQRTAAGVVRGTSASTYNPRAIVRRDQMASFLVGAFQYVDQQALPDGPPRFSDTAGNLHEPNIDKIAEAGFAAGRADGTYGPRADVRRDQMATFLANVLQRLVEDGRVQPVNRVVRTLVREMADTRSGLPETRRGQMWLPWISHTASATSDRFSAGNCGFYRRCR